MKRILLFILLPSIMHLSINAEGENMKQEKEYHYLLSSHILDLVKGQPAKDVEVILQKLESNGINWSALDVKKTDDDGRITDFLKVAKGEESTLKGIYKLTFYTKPYFDSENRSTFYPFIEVVFEITGEGHYHVPITLSPYGYSTYRGS